MLAQWHPPPASARWRVADHSLQRVNVHKVHSSAHLQERLGQLGEAQADVLRRLSALEVANDGMLSTSSSTVIQQQLRSQLQRDVMELEARLAQETQSSQQAALQAAQTVIEVCSQLQHGDICCNGFVSPVLLQCCHVGAELLHSCLGHCKCFARGVYRTCVFAAQCLTVGHLTAAHDHQSFRDSEQNRPLTRQQVLAGQTCCNRSSYQRSAGRHHETGSCHQKAAVHTDSKRQQQRESAHTTASVHLPFTCWPHDGQTHSSNEFACKQKRPVGLQSRLRVWKHTDTSSAGECHRQIKFQGTCK
jgi:hypothetical protein